MGYLPEGVKSKSESSEKIKIVPAPPVGDINVDIRIAALNASARFNADRVASATQVLECAELFESYLRGQDGPPQEQPSTGGVGESDQAEESSTG